MARRPDVSDEQLLEIAREMHTAGDLTVRALRARVTDRTGGGCDYGRALTAVQTIRAEAEEARAGARLMADGGKAGEFPAPDIPPTIQDAVARLLALIASAVNEARREENVRARAAEEALKAQHQEGLEALKAEQDRLMADLRAAVDDASLAEAERDVALENLEKARRKQAEAEAHREATRKSAEAERERMDKVLQELTDDLRRTQYGFTEALEAKREAEIKRQGLADELSRARTDVTRLSDDIKQLKDDLAAMSEHSSQLEGLLGELKQERDRAVDRAEAAVERAALAKQTAEERRAEVERLLTILEARSAPPPVPSPDIHQDPPSSEVSSSDVAAGAAPSTTDTGRARSKSRRRPAKEP